MLLLKLGRPSLIGFPTLLTSGGIAIKSQKQHFHTIWKTDTSRLYAKLIAR